jgi:hypothetical protein
MLKGISTGFVSTVAALALVAGPFQVQWSSPQREALSIRVVGAEAALGECLDSGRKGRLKVEFRVCRSSPAWFDSCRPTQSGINSIEFDAISESFRVVSDLRDDGSDAIAVGMPNRPEALQAAVEVRALPLEFLAQGDTFVLKEPGTYVQLRATTSCRGSVNRILVHLSEIVTLGMVTAGESASDWFDFTLATELPVPQGAPRDTETAVKP